MKKLLKIILRDNLNTLVANSLLFEDKPAPITVYEQWRKRHLIQNKRKTKDYNSMYMSNIKTLCASTYPSFFYSSAI